MHPIGDVAKDPAISRRSPLLIPHDSRCLQEDEWLPLAIAGGDLEVPDEALFLQFAPGSFAISGILVQDLAQLCAERLFAGPDCALPAARELAAEAGI